MGPVVFVYVVSKLNQLFWNRGERVRVGLGQQLLSGFQVAPAGNANPLAHVRALVQEASPADNCSATVDDRLDVYCDIIFHLGAVDDRLVGHDDPAADMYRCRMDDAPVLDVGVLAHDERFESLFFVEAHYRVGSHVAAGLDDHSTDELGRIVDE